MLVEKRPNTNVTEGIFFFKHDYYKMSAHNSNQPGNKRARVFIRLRCGRFNFGMGIRLLWFLNPGMRRKRMEQPAAILGLLRPSEQESHLPDNKKRNIWNEGRQSPLVRPFCSFSQFATRSTKRTR